METRGEPSGQEFAKGEIINTTESVVPIPAVRPEKPEIDYPQPKSNPTQVENSSIHEPRGERSIRRTPTEELTYDAIGKLGVTDLQESLGAEIENNAPRE